MAEDIKQKKVETGRSLFDNYLKKKHHESHRRPEDAELEEECEGKHQSMTSASTGKNKMDSPTLQKKTAHFVSLKSTIRQLQDTVSEKNEIIDALEIENRMLRQGRGDEAGSSEREQEEKMIRELQTMVDARDTYIGQLSDSLQMRSEELSSALKKEKDLTNEIQNVQLEMKYKLKHNEVKLNESFTELVGNKAKVEVLTSQVQQYSEMVKSLRFSLESSNQKIEMQQHEILEKDKKVDRLKFDAAQDIKKLMRQVEELNHEISKKSKELIESRKEVETLRSCMEEQIGGRIGALRTELEKKYNEDVRKVEVIYDNMMLEHIRKSDTELKSIEKCNELEKQISSCRHSYEQEISRYKEDLNQLLEKSRLTEENLLFELEKYKEEADKYKQQVEHFKNNLSEDECERKSSKDNDMEKMHYYQEEIAKLSNELQIYAINEARKEVELETYRSELKNREQKINGLKSEVESYKEAFEAQKVQLSQFQSELNCSKESNAQFQAKLYQFQLSEHKLLNEFKLSNAKLEEYKQQVLDLNEKIRLDSDQFNVKYEQRAQTFEEQVQTLMNTIERNKALHQEDVNCLAGEINEQQVEINNLEAKLAHLQGMNQATTEDLDTLYNTTTRLSKMNQDSETTKREFLMGIWNGLKNIKAQIRTLLKSNDLGLAPQGEQSFPSVENSGNISFEELTEEVEKTLGDVLDMTQYLHNHGGDISHLPQYCQQKSAPQHPITSTPNINRYYNKSFKNTSETLTSENADIQSSTDEIKSWAVKYAKLEEENTTLGRNLKLLMGSVYEMETCLFVVSQESNLFNKKCQMLDAKLTELENSKLSEFLLKKENDELKQQLRSITDSEEKLHEELVVLQNKNINLEEIIKKNISDVLEKLENNDSNTELEHVLADLKRKSDEIIDLKLQIASLQKSEKEQRSKFLDIQSKYECFIAKHEFLTAELNSKTKELEEIWQEKYKLSTENKFLCRKLTVQGKLPDQSNSNNLNEPSPDNNNIILSEPESDGNREHFDRELTSIPRALQKCVLNRMESLELISNSPNLTRSIEDGFPSRSCVSLDEQMNELQRNYLPQRHYQEEDLLNYHMPTILEEEDREEDWNCYPIVQDQVYN